MMYKVLIFIFIYIAPGSLLANNGIEKNTWEKATKNYNFDETFKEPNKKKDKENNEPVIQKSRSKNSITIPSFIKLLPLLALGAILIILILKLVNNAPGFVTKPHKNINIEEFDDPNEFTKSDLEIHLEKAIHEKNYRLAIRIHFLIIIKQLQDKELIKWRKEKTNLDYYHEIERLEIKDPFKQLVLIFEKIWYANYQVNHATYNDVSSKFEKLFQKIEA